MAGGIRATLPNRQHFYAEAARRRIAAAMKGDGHDTGQRAIP